MQRLRPKLNRVSGARLFLQAVQDLRIGGRQSAAEYQYTLTSDDTAALYTLDAEAGRLSWQASRRAGGREYRHAAERPADLSHHRPRRPRRATASRRTRSTACCTTPSASAPSRPSSIPFNQYFVVMEVAPKYWQYPQILEQHLSSAPPPATPTGTQQTQTPGGTVSAVTPLHGRRRRTAAATSTQRAQRQRAGQRGDQQHLQQPRRHLQRQRRQHRGGDHGAAAAFVELRQQPHRDPGQPPERPGGRDDLLQPAARRLAEQGAAAIEKSMHDLGMPASIHGGFAGAGQAFAQSMSARCRC